MHYEQDEDSVLLRGISWYNLGDRLPSPAEILHGRIPMTKRATALDMNAVRTILIQKQMKYTLSCNKNHQIKCQRACNWWSDFLSTNDALKHYITVCIYDNDRNDYIQTENGAMLSRSRSHMKPASFDIQLIPSPHFVERTKLFTEVHKKHQKTQSYQSKYCE